MMDKIREYLEAGGVRGLYPAVKYATRKVLETYDGQLNYLLSESNLLFVHCNYRRMYMLRREKEYGGAVLVSTQKLTNERWVEIPRNRVLCLSRGEVLVLSNPIRP